MFGAGFGPPDVSSGDGRGFDLDGDGGIGRRRAQLPVRVAAPAHRAATGGDGAAVEIAHPDGSREGHIQWIIPPHARDARVVSAHVWSRPALSAAASPIPALATAAMLNAVVNEMPSCACVFSPQQCTPPPARTQV